MIARSARTRVFADKSHCIVTAIVETPPPVPTARVQMDKLMIVSLALFFVACCLPSLEFRDGKGIPDIMLGLRALVVGWSGLFGGVLGWYANPFWLASVLLLAVRKPMPAGLLGVVAVGIAFLTLSAIGRELPGDEGNVTKTTITAVLPGFYVWIASMGIVPIAAWFQRAA